MIRRGQYAGKRIFLLATGPSIAEENLTPLADEFTFGCGRIAFWHRGHTDLYVPDGEGQSGLASPGLPFFPNFYGLTEWGTKKQLEASVEREPDTEFIYYSYSIPYCKSQNWFNPSYETMTDEWFADPPINVVFRKSDEDGFARDIFTYGVSGFDEDPEVTWMPGMSGLEAAQTAIWMGFTEIYLLGFEFSFRPHVFGDTRNLDPDPSAYVLEDDKRDAVLRRFRADCEANSVRVVNLSSFTNDKVFDKADLASLF